MSENILSRGETRILRRELTENDISTREAALERTFTDQREIQAEFTAFRKWAEPRIRRAFDPNYENAKLDGEAELTIEEAFALQNELDRRRVGKTTRVAQLKAERAALIAAIASEVEYRVVEVDAIANYDTLTVAFVVPDTGEVVDQRGMTEAERQQTLGADFIPASSGAPATVQ